MGTFRATHRKVSRPFRRMPRRTFPSREASQSVPRAAAPVVSLATNQQAKIAANGVRGIALATSLVIHAGIALGCVVWGTTTGMFSMRSAVPVEILAPTAVKSAAVHAMAPAMRPRNRTRLSVEVKLALPARNDVQPLAHTPQAPPAIAAPADPESSPETMPVATGSSAGSLVGTNSVVPAPAASLPPAAVAASATDTRAVAEIVRRLRSAAASCYPYAAVRSNLEGTTRLRFCIDQRGEPRDGQVVDSSGFALLDAAALDCVLPSAAPFPTISRPCVTVPVRFELQR